MDLLAFFLLCFFGLSYQVFLSQRITRKVKKFWKEEAEKKILKKEEHDV